MRSNRMKAEQAQRDVMWQAPATIAGAVVVGVGAGTMIAVVEPGAVALLKQYGPVVVRQTLKGGKKVVQMSKQAYEFAQVEAGKHVGEIVAVTEVTQGYVEGKTGTANQNRGAFFKLVVDFFSVLKSFFTGQ